MYFMHTNVDCKQSLSLIVSLFLPISVDAVNYESTSKKTGTVYSLTLCIQIL